MSEVPNIQSFNSVIDDVIQQQLDQAASKALPRKWPGMDHVVRLGNVSWFRLEAQHGRPQSVGFNVGETILRAVSIKFDLTAIRNNRQACFSNAYLTLRSHGEDALDRRIWLPSPLSGSYFTYEQPIHQTDIGLITEFATSPQSKWRRISRFATLQDEELDDLFPRLDQQSELQTDHTNALSRMARDRRHGPPHDAVVS